jgi:hypothetical protein
VSDSSQSNEGKYLYPVQKLKLSFCKVSSRRLEKTELTNNKENPIVVCNSLINAK